MLPDADPQQRRGLEKVMELQYWLYRRDGVLPCTSPLLQIGDMRRTEGDGPLILTGPP